ncbi:Hypothetical_protein [Hexamita inflata]|uniref:Hypothetical_protein n=1 Tax=Hexamita inflata TaxID=28002 RepID=A0AA86QJW4_9EUKA|nr:Hypothetical protein HINF_LOCUS42084 [Hexamita inflata]
MLHQIFAGYSSAKHIQSGRVLASDNQVSGSPTRDGPHFLIFKFYIFDSRKSNFWKSSSVCELDQALKRICKLIKQTSKLIYCDNIKNILSQRFLTCLLINEHKKVEYSKHFYSRVRHQWHQQIYKERF